MIRNSDPSATPRPRPLEWAAGAALILVMLVGAAQAIAAWRVPAEHAVPVTPKSVLNGALTKDWSDRLDANMPWRAQMITLANGLRYRLFNGGGEDVRVGRDGWLYLTEEFRSDGHDAANLQRRVKLLAQTQQALAADGVQLLIALVPDKSRAVDRFVPSPLNRNTHARRYSDAMAALTEQGLQVVDLRPALVDGQVGAQRFYRTDTHWNDEGAAAAAALVAAKASALTTCGTPTSYQTTVAAAKPYAGDLSRLMGLQTAPRWLSPPTDTERAHNTQAQAAADQGDAGLGLFGSRQVSYVLTGTSFSRRGNFHGALQQALSCEVLNTAKDGGGLLDGMGQYLSDAAFAESKPSLLIWEIPERFLTLALTTEDRWLDSVGLASP